MLSGVCLVLIGIFILQGLNERNLSYNLPRRSHIVFALVLISFSVSWSATVFQTISENQILTPSLIGLDALYLFIQTAVVYFLGSQRLTAMNNPRDFLFTVLAMVAAAGVLYAVMFRGRRGSIHLLILVGLVAGQLFRALASFMQLRIDPDEFSVVQGRMFASFNNLNLDLSGISIVCVALAFALTFRDTPCLDVLALGRDQAVGLGVPYRAVVRRQLFMIAVLISVATVLGGPVTFLSLLAVNAARRLLHTHRHFWLGLGSTLVSLACLLTAQLLVERVFNFNMPCNVIINLAGGLYLLYLLIRQGRNG